MKLIVVLLYDTPGARLMIVPLNLSQLTFMFGAAARLTLKVDSVIRLVNFASLFRLFTQT